MVIKRHGDYWSARSKKYRAYLEDEFNSDSFLAIDDVKKLVDETNEKARQKGQPVETYLIVNVEWAEWIEDGVFKKRETIEHVVEEYGGEDDV